MPTAAYYTLGCKINQYETEQIRREMEKFGFTTVSFAAEADVYVINSCTVTNTADSKSRRAVRQAVKRNPDAIIVATGCYAELEPSSLAAIAGVDMIVGNTEKESISERIAARFPGVTPKECAPVLPRTRTRAIVKVQDGCSQFCAYCTVPYARSVQWSRPISEVVDELRVLVDFGYKEIVLSGIRLGSYRPGLSQLIEASASVEGIERIRLSSLEVWEIDDRLLDTLSNTQKVCRHLHIPLQSGDLEVLQRMRRPYSPEDYRRTVEKARSAIPNLGLTTDIIVGFPGETEDHFDRTLAFVDSVQFSRIHVFRYSPRPRTAAAAFSDQVSSEEKSLRSERMIALGSQMSRSFAEKLVGNAVNVLLESKQGEHLHGFTDNYVEVQFPGSDKLRGRIESVFVERITDSGAAFGSIVSS